MSWPFSSPVLVRGGRLVDPIAGTVEDGVDLLIVDGVIQEVGRGLTSGLEGLTEVSAAGRWVFPGLVDCHVHVFAAIRDLQKSAAMPWTYVTSSAVALLKAMARRGFTTVRDTGGADWGIAQAITDGLLGTVPHLKFGGPALSQTGGHGDFRGRGGGDEPCCALGKVCDGVDEVRRLTRQQIANGASHIKIMLGGGVASALDRLDRNQFTDEEVRVVVEEATVAGIYVTAHAYTAEAVTRGALLGLRSVEHGNLIDAATAKLMGERGMFLVPTLVAYEDLQDDVDAGTAAPYIAPKLAQVREGGLRSLELAAEAGVPIAYGTDLLGVGHPRQLEEFAIRSRVQTPIEMLRSATAVGRALLDGDEREALLVPGNRADLVIADLDPTTESLEHLGTRDRLVMIGGRLLDDPGVPR